MRKTNSGPRSQNGNSQKQHHRGGRPSSGTGRSSNGGNDGNNGNRNRNSNSRSRNQASQMWLQASPKTLTSHIPLVNKNAQRDGDQKKGDGRNENSNGSGNGRHRNKNRSASNKNRQGQYNKPGGKPNTPRRNPASNPSSGATRSAGREAQDTRRDDRLVANIEPFDLFCAYHLGITRDKQYKQANINQVGNRFNADPATIRQALKQYNMDSESLLDRDFDMALAQLDIQVAPEGVDILELAKNIYGEFLEAPVKKRDWKKILEEDRKENQKVFRN